MHSGTTTTARARAAAALTAVLCAAVLSACSSSGSAAGTSGGKGSGTVPAAGAAKGGAPAPKPKATCDQLTVADVQPLIAGPITKSPATVVGMTDDPGQSCDFDDADGSTALEVVVLPGTLAAQAYQDDVKKQTAGSVAISGVGDKASHAKGDTSVSAISGSTYCFVSGEDEDMPGVGDWESAHGGTSTLSDPIADAAANAVATVCNRVFGSGTTTPDLDALHAAVSAS